MTNKHKIRRPGPEKATLREQYLEYGIIAGICKEMWQRGREMDILRSHTDQGGYDILLEVAGLQRHIQLKSSFVGAKTSKQKINLKLTEKPSGCVVWMLFDHDTLDQAGFLWFGGKPGQPLPNLGDRIARHTKGDASGHKAKRLGFRVLNKGAFVKLESFYELTSALFGE